LRDLNILRPAAAFLGHRLGLTSEEEEIALFGLQTLIYPMISFLLVVIAGHIFGCLWHSLTVFTAMFLLRVFSGGAHSDSPLKCSLIGTVVVVSLGKSGALTAPLFNSANLSLLVIFGAVLCLLINWRLAPVDSPAKPINDFNHRKKLRLLSMITVFVITTFQLLLLFYRPLLSIVLAVSLGLWWQTFTLTKAGHRFAILADNLKGRR
jgi:accessory gene regulator B